MLRTHAAMFSRLHPIVPLVLCALLGISTGCDLTRLTANTTAGLFSRSSSGLEQHFDYELVGDGLPASILQLEGVMRVVPDNEALGLTLMRAYCSYSFGWVEDEVEQVQDRGDLDEETRLNG